MARNRMIKPEFWEDFKIASLSDKAKLLYIALWNFADDEGFLEDNPAWISIKCFPYEKTLEIEKVLQELYKIEVLEKRNGIIHIKNFLKHQKLNRPTKSELSSKFNEYSKKKNKENTQLTEHSLSTHTQLTEHSLPKIEVEEEENMKEKGIERECEQPAKQPPAPLVDNSQEAKPLNQQQQLWEYFAQKYKTLTGKNYLADKKDFVILAKLLKIKNITAFDIRQRIDWLCIGCEHPGVYWFAKDKTDFTIGTLKSHWNHILPKLTEEQKKQYADYERKRQLVIQLQKQGIDISMEEGQQIAQLTEIINAPETQETAQI